MIRQDTDSNKELPIADADITVADGLALAGAHSDALGYFRLTLLKRVRRGQPITIQFRHPDYRPLDLHVAAGDQLYIAHMIPVKQEVHVDSHRPETVVSNIKVRYTVSSTSSMNIGSAVKAFQVVNAANVPCNGQLPCSPDGKWKAAIATASLDAGVDNEFKNARASCIAGPCPFTRIEADGFSRGGRRISVAARDWSDTATFLLEAEVMHQMVSDNVRQSYPVIFGQALNFTLPASAEGVSIEAEINGAAIIFPLGPDLFLSWADCNARVNRDQTKVYRCEVKPGHRF
ncbi:MAG: hypothetical protein NVS1B11_27600 [Terriglobales bacterium]